MPEDLIHIYMADDDEDDCLLFGDVLQEVKRPTRLTTAANGAALIRALESVAHEADLPHVIFLDLNMPIKGGIESLKEIKQKQKLRHLPIIIYSTSAQKEVVDSAYDNGAALFFRKPDSFAKLKQVLQKILDIKWNRRMLRPPREEFLIEV